MEVVEGVSFSETTSWRKELESTATRGRSGHARKCARTQRDLRKKRE